MRRRREERGVALRDIATATKISVSALEALERNDISRLPGGIFLRAIVRNYATEIGADPEETVREFIECFPDESVVAGGSHVYETDYEKTTAPRRGRMRLPFAIAVVLIVITLVWSFFAFR